MCDNVLNLLTKRDGALRGELRRNESMAKYVSWRAGGIADQLYKPADIADFAQYLRGLPGDMPVYCMGLGSNLLVRDGGVRGAVVLLHGALRELRLEEKHEDYGLIYAEAGVALPKLARFAAGHDLVSAEFMAGIPGTVGGALTMNAGCYGGETWQVAVRALTINRRGRLQQREREAYTLGYRHVELDSGEEEWFAGAWFALPVGDGVSSRAAIRELLRRRIESQPLSQPNAGSVFRNPEHDYAARLIEACGLKGKRIGGAEVSGKHANFIINQASASAADIESLIEYVADTVAERTGIVLQCEVRIIGERLGGSK
ncbi:MAG TPA: UDP-N-acetylmuramate dehydrogenase [Burkholderiales bacterium]|nr:UDP-N-acetylmuramate dehydrogenase [Burkholderiales bacterium]